MKVSIDDVSRLRKLKKTEDEAVIEGDDYATRLKDHYLTKIQGEHSMFDWARPKETSGRKLSTLSEDKTSAGLGKKTKMLADSSSDEDEEEDPIGDLLKSNTAIFSKNEELLKSGSL